MNKYSLSAALALICACIIFSCSGDDEKKTGSQEDPGNNESYTHNNVLPESRGSVDLPREIDSSLIRTSQSIENIDLNMDISGLSVQELRLLRNAIYARYGHCFMKADLRGYFSANTSWYDKLMEDRYFAEEEGKAEPVQLTAEEMKFVDRVEKREKELLNNNFYDNKGYRLANTSNIVNLFQFKSMPKDFIQMLDRQNFVIAPSDQIQLFHIYEQNDYNQVPNYVTTDLFLQLYHMYFSYVLKSLEMGKFNKLVTDLSSAMYKESSKTAGSTRDGQLKSAAEFNAVFYAIPYTILTGKKVAVPQSLSGMYNTELANIEAAKDAMSPLVKGPVNFPYSLFKPRGHYTRNETLKKYFKAMMWLQYAWNCLNEDDRLRNAMFSAWLMNSGKDANGKPLSEVYNNVYEPVLFLIGEPDNLSIMDIVDYMKKNPTVTLEKLSGKSLLSDIRSYLQEVYKGRNRVYDKVSPHCDERINFMPQRYLADNEILNEMADTVPNAERHMPKGLDVFASFGVNAAEDLLRNFHGDDKKWDLFDKRLDMLKKKFTGFSEWDRSVYNKWMQGLVDMQKKDKNYPGYMQTPLWDRKNLNTALASWAELKHDAILYAEQPMAAECGSGGPPPPVTVGYVEPNVHFWKRMNELCKLTEDVLTRNKLMDDDLKGKQKEIATHAAFLLSASEKELKGQKLSEQEYNSIEIIGSSVEWLTLSILGPDIHTDRWENVTGPDKSIAVVADIYTRGILGCNKNGVLHVATGKANEIYVVVEIEGYLYLTKGAVFSYYEFQQPDTKRLTDEEWQEMLEDVSVPAIPGWMKEIIIQEKLKPETDEKMFYSSGC